MALRRVKKRKERRQKIVMSIILTFLMAASGFGIYLSGRGSEENQQKDKGLSFTINYDLDVYQTKINGQKMNFRFLPTTVQNIPVHEQVITTLQGASAVVITFDPTTDQLSLQAIDLMRLELPSLLQKPFINAVNTENSLYQLPLITCDNATAQLPIISIEEGNDSKIIQENNCIKIISNTTGFLEAKDRLVYEYYGVYNQE